jgi:UDP-N-acetylglucosamine 2-epimerase (non-hydrolysing)
MVTVAVIGGTRPEAIKLAPVVLALRGRDGVRCRVCATGQHPDLFARALAIFGLRADAQLDTLRPGQPLSLLLARMLEGLDAWLDAEKPHLVVVQGDTTSTLAGAMAAFHRRIPVAHVEAGLRTGDLAAPWPEEANRLQVARLARLHFAPTAAARENLRREGVAPEAIHVTGNTAIDALLWVRERAAPPPEADAAPTVVFTAHRRENFGAPLAAVCEAVADLASRFPGVRFVATVHPNPAAASTIREILGRPDDPRLSAGNVRLVDPPDYPEFVALLDHSRLVLTDSGGIQEEAPSLGVPVLVLRRATERLEAVEAGIARLVGTDRARIVAEASRHLAGPDERVPASPHPTPFGDGRAAIRIVEACLALLNGGTESADLNLTLRAST